MSIEDYGICLIDTIDALASLAMSQASSAQQNALRVNAGLILTILREQLDDLDYAYMLFICEIEEVTADHYRRLYLESACEQACSV